MSLRDIGIACTGVIGSQETAASEINGCLSLARAADEFGYSRFWVSEHHEAASAWASPTQFLAAIGVETSRIRIGSAVVLLGLHAPINIAEAYSFLTTMCPLRVDCGVGGAFMDPIILAEYNKEAAMDSNFLSKQFLPNLEQLLKYFQRDYPQGHRLQMGTAPAGAHAPEMWVMGVNGVKGRIAAKYGTRFCYSSYHSRSARNPEEVKEYIEYFQPSTFHSSPHAVVAVRVVCAEDHATARRLAGVPREVSGTEPIWGVPEDCIEQLEECAWIYGVSELIVNFEMPTSFRIKACSLLWSAFRDRSGVR